MRALILVMLIIVMQGCGQLTDTGAKMCDGVKNTLKPASLVEGEEVNEVKDIQKDKSDQTLLMYRMLHSL